MRNRIVTYAWRLNEAGYERHLAGETFAAAIYWHTYRTILSIFAR